MDGGIVPVKLFLARDKFVSSVKLPREEGIIPVIDYLREINEQAVSMVPMHEGMLPPRSRFSITNLVSWVFLNSFSFKKEKTTSGWCGSQVVSQHNPFFRFGLIVCSDSARGIQVRRIGCCRH